MRRLGTGDIKAFTPCSLPTIPPSNEAGLPRLSSGRHVPKKREQIKFLFRQAAYFARSKELTAWSLLSMISLKQWSRPPRPTEDHLCISISWSSVWLRSVTGTLAQIRDLAASSLRAPFLPVKTHERPGPASHARCQPAGRAGGSPDVTC